MARQTTEMKKGWQTATGDPAGAREGIEEHVAGVMPAPPQTFEHRKAIVVAIDGLAVDQARAGP
jgi:hypothetical protein